MTEQELFESQAFLLECAWKEAEDWYASGREEQAERVLDEYTALICYERAVWEAEQSEQKEERNADLSC